MKLFYTLYIILTLLLTFKYIVISLHRTFKNKTMIKELTWHQRWKRYKAGMCFTNADVAEITGLTAGYITSATAPSKEFPEWAKLTIVTYERLVLNS